MTLIDLGLLLILAALIAIVPIGCRMTRQKKLDAPRGDISA
jgi:hypothetical protein